MSNLPPSSYPPSGQVVNYTNQVQIDEQLKMLSIFWWVIAGLQALAGCLFLLYVGFGIVMMVLGGAAGAGSREPGAAVPFMGMGAFMVCFGIVLLAFIWGIAFLNYTVGKSLRERRRLTLCYVMAAIICLGFPLGTALGVFTFVTLSKPGVKESFR